MNDTYLKTNNKKKCAMTLIVQNLQDVIMIKLSMS